MKAVVQTGADRLAEAEAAWLPDARIGLLTNPTGINARFESTIELLAGSKRAKLAALLACEHGIRGDRQAGVLFEDERDERLGIPVFSLYSAAGKRLQPHMLEAIDAVVFDIQDVGVRFYTYLSTLLMLLEECAAAGKPLVVLDRPNPFGSGAGEGGLLAPGFESFVGAARLPICTGLTIGETALYMNSLLAQKCELTVVPLAGWDRSMTYERTGLPWMVPSPNMPTPETVRVYGGTCLFEGTNLSEGRGTTRPFELIGAPWVNGERLARELNGRGLPGVHALPWHFTPTFSKHQGELCGGVRLFVTEPAAYRPVLTGLHLLDAVQSLFPDRFAWLPPYREGGRPFIDLLTGGDAVRTTLGKPGGLSRILQDWERDEALWNELRRPYCLYN
ncbi:hypothetical protein SD70_00150 [Gordoniibacillus kamchatkensis]|uniref:DUF1343 domain-containing protein n=1 Tax=Gordoniibacillus kamchatkensis TaxID=1590651 RepID=A0ABR5ANH1_9BACL|nr:DUF1343 domain-containing protein [Paenibacillus sp. VKM B-2647]KIL42531.1 hypothetical protein SD70_00150 [Paenibacillus sp. VKM B-2647]